MAEHATSFLNLIKGAPFGIFVVDAGLSLVEISAGAKQVLNAVELFPGSGLADLLGAVCEEKQAAEVVERFRQTLATGEPYLVSNTAEKRKGRSEADAFDWKIERIVLPDGADGVVCYFYDLCGKKSIDLHPSEGELIFRSLSDSLPAHIAVIDQRGDIVAINEPWRKFAVQNSDSRSETMAKVGIGVNYFEVCRAAQGEYTGSAEAALQGVRDVLDGKKDSFSIEYPCHSASRQRWFLMHCSRLEPSNDGAVISHTDITLHKAVEKYFRQSEETYRTLFDNSPVPMWVYDLETLRFLEVNAAAIEHYGYTRDEFLAMSIKDIRPDEEISRLLNALADNKEPLKGPDIWTHLRKDGSIIKTEIISHLLDFNGRDARLVVAGDITERFRAEEKLRLSEGRYRLLFKDNPFPMIIYDFDTLRFLDVNEATCLHYGYTREEFLTMKLTDIGSPVDLKNIRSTVSQNDNKRTIYGEWKHKKKDGTEIWVETASHKLDIEGEHSRIVLISDVTEKKKAEEELREAEERFRATFEQAAVGIAHIAIDGKWTLVNEQLCKITGYSKEELNERNFQNLLHPDETESGSEFLNKILTGEIDHYSRERRYMRKDRSAIWISKTVSLARDSDGSPKYFISVIADISTRKAAETELIQWADAFENCAHGIALGNPKTNRVIAVNAAFARMCGKSKDEIADQPILSVYAPETHDAVKKSIMTADSQGAVQYEALIKRKDGTAFAAQMDLVSVRSESGEMLYRVATMQDISARKKAEAALRESEEKLRQSQKMEAIGRLAGGIAHDFNNMLTVIKGYSDLSLRLVPKDSQLYRFLSEIHKAGEHSSSLINQLLAFSRTQILRPEKLDINQKISETIKMIKPMIGEDIKIELELEPLVGCVEADPGQISQVMVNLLLNARDAMPTGGKIMIRTDLVFLDKIESLPESSESGGQYVRMEVRDTGQGMDRHTLENIFEPFFTTKEIGKGTGLGLSTVYGIVRQSGGNILVRSEPEMGTTFEIFLPQVSKDGADGAQGELPGELLCGRGTILIVEDEELVRHLTRDALEESGYTVIEARNGAEAIELFAKQDLSVDLLMTDIVMPEMSGYDLFRKLSSLSTTLPRFLFTSGYLDDERVRDTSFDLDRNFIKKPFRLNELTDKIRELLSSDQPN